MDGSLGLICQTSLRNEGKAGGKTDSFQGTDLYRYGDWLSSPRTIGTPEEVRAGAPADSGSRQKLFPDIGFLFLEERVLPDYPDYSLTRHQLTRSSNYI